MGFEVFQKSSAPVSKVPTVTLQKSGIMSLNRAAYDLIGSPGYVELLWDAGRSVIGMRPTVAENPNAYPARPLGTRAEKGPWLVAGAVFMRHYGIEREESRRWVVRVEDGVLCIDLNQDSQRAASNRSGRSAKSAAAAE